MLLIYGTIYTMHKTFYASGFIYHFPSQKILLQQLQTITSPWVLFEKEYTENEQPEIIFKNTIRKFLGIEIAIIYPIYSYRNETTTKHRTLLYASIDHLQEFSQKNDYIFRWFSFKEVLRIPAIEQTKHDIIVGQRVIEAAERRANGEHTFQ